MISEEEEEEGGGGGAVNVFPPPHPERKKKKCDSLMNGTGNVTMIPRPSAVIREGRKRRKERRERGGWQAGQCERAATAARGPGWRESGISQVEEREMEGGDLGEKEEKGGGGGKQEGARTSLGAPGK